MTQEEIYLQGYIEKCAEYGIDGEELYKYAQRGVKLLSAVKKLADPAMQRYLPRDFTLHGMTPGAVLEQLKGAVGSLDHPLGQALTSAGRGSSGGFVENLAIKAKDARKGLKALSSRQAAEAARKAQDAISKEELGALAGILG